jgi:hypothetical protein
MKDELLQFMSGDLSRRNFGRALAALGICTAAADSIIRSADAVEVGPPGIQGREVTGTGGQILVEQMKDAGVKYLFTNPGSFEVGLFDAFLGRDDMQIIVGLHEGLVIAMADGYHKVSGKPGFVNVHVIAGTAQAAGQMYNASRDRSSLIVTAGMIDNETFSDNVLLGARPGYDQKEINRQFTKISWESKNAASIGVMLRRAFKVATTAPPGPVYLAIPHTVLESPNISASVYDDDGEFQGVVSSSIATSPTLGRHRLSEPRQKVVVVGRGDRIAARPGAAVQPFEFPILIHDNYKPGQEPIEFADKKLLDNSNPSSDDHHDDSILPGRWLAAVEPVDDADFWVVVQQRFDEAIPPVLSMTRSLVFWLGAALAMVLLLIAAALSFWKGKPMLGQQRRVSS